MTCTDEAPYSLISVTPSARKSSQRARPRSRPLVVPPGRLRVRTSVVPINLSRSPRWLSTCTAVVGSLSAGERALIAMSTMIRIANAGSCSIVRSTPSDDGAPEQALGIVGIERTAVRGARALRRARSRRPNGEGRAGSRGRRRTGRARTHRSPGSRRHDCFARRGSAPRGVRYGSRRSRGVGRVVARTPPSNARRPVRRRARRRRPGRSRWRKRSRKRRKRTVSEPRGAPATRHTDVGTESLSTRRRSPNENVNVPISTASSDLSRRSRYRAACSAPRTCSSPSARRERDRHARTR